MTAWWGSALGSIAHAVATRLRRDEDRRCAEDGLIGVVSLQARYLHGLFGAWPTSVALPHKAPGVGTVRVHERYKASGRFEPGDRTVLFTRWRAIDIKVDEVRNSNGFWAAEIPGRADHVLFWPAPKEPPEWWEAR